MHLYEYRSSDVSCRREEMVSGETGVLSGCTGVFVDTTAGFLVCGGLW